MADKTQSYMNLTKGYATQSDGTDAEVIVLGEDCELAITNAAGEAVYVRPGTSAEWKLAAGANGVGKLTENSGVDIGDVTVNNAAGAAAYVQPGTDAEWQVLGDSYATPTHSVVTVTTASGSALAGNAARKYALLVNDSDTTIYIKLGADAVANQGIRLNANGGSYEMSRLHGNLYAGEINAIHGSTGNKTLLVTEGV